MRLLAPLAVSLMLLAPVAPAEAALLGPSAYVTTADSPFTPGNFGYFHLETFDDHALNTPGVTGNGSPSATLGFSGSIIDQVGVAGGCPAGGLAAACDTYFASPGSTGITFQFSKAALGALPTAVGVVWTDGAGDITFEAFDENGISLGTVPGSHADGSVNGTIEDDRFYGATNAGGISAVRISNTSGGIEVDHLQYGGPLTVVGTPFPGSLILVGAGLAAFGAARVARRKR